ncbi:uncharacterized protein LOC117642423 [Thrips palmi]|uniref:Uncharacterized protein LOC117642423 n=1 Tax=Thrips palmi TaxID=161013 RepID=A0A6P8YA75_THRPL|nr:uncharacterized protein LOC117642423 [Thrips palmi]
MAAGMEIGSRVERGVHWDRGPGVGTAPGRGTVTKVDSSFEVFVKWDRTGQICGPYSMGHDGGRYHLSLLVTAAMVMVPYLESDLKVLDAASLRSCAEATEAVKESRCDQVVGLQCNSLPAVSLTVLKECAKGTYGNYGWLRQPGLQGLQMVSPLQQHLEAALAMPRLRALSITNITGPQLQQVTHLLGQGGQLAWVQRLELHCPFGAPLFMLTSLATPSRKGSLRWLRCGVHPLVVALVLMRAHADSLEELQLVAATTEPYGLTYGCPDLAQQLRGCGFKKLNRMVLLRHDAYDGACRHDNTSCKAQMASLWEMFVESNLRPTMLCSLCDRVA